MTVMCQTVIFEPHQLDLACLQLRYPLVVILLSTPLLAESFETGENLLGDVGTSHDQIVERLESVVDGGVGEDGFVVRRGQELVVADIFQGGVV